MNWKKNRWLLLSFLLIFAMIVAACGDGAEETAVAETEAAEEPAPPPEVTEPTSAIDCKGASSGDEVTLLYQWSGEEEEKFNAAVAPVVEECGITLVPESSRDQAVLDTRVSSGDPWDIVIWPTTGPMLTYGDSLVPLADAGAHPENYADYWISLGTSGGAWFGIPVKADIKSIVWYSPLAFEANGYAVPGTLDELTTLVDQMVADGNVPWSMGMESGPATGWTGSDFIQDLMLAQQGPDFVLGLIDGSVAYDDAGVAEAFALYESWAADADYTVAGANGTLSTGFINAIYKPFADPAEAMMVKQSGFAGGVVSEQFPELVYGEDYDFFPFPGAQGMQGGADWLMVFNASPAAQAIVAYLTSTEGGENWASVGFDLSPNSAAVGSYEDDQLAKKADALAAASGFTPDIGDTIPGGFGAAEWAAIVDVVSGAASIDIALQNAAAVQAEAVGLSVDLTIDCMGASAGDEVTLLYQWSGAEEENFSAIMQPLVDECGIVLVPESSRDQAVLDTRVGAGDPWDIIIWPTTGPMNSYSDLLTPLEDAGADAGNYRQFWIDLGSVNPWLAVPVKVDIKTIVWYSPIAFEAAGYSVPTTFADLQSLVDQMVADGNVPWSMGMESGAATGWTGSDFIQDVLLATQGPDYVLGIIDGSIPYDDAGVVEAYEIYAGWAADALYTVGGSDGTLSTGFIDAIYKPFADPPEAMMVKQSGFAGGVVAEQFPELVYGEDYDFFAFPGAQGMQGGADWLMVFNPSPAAQAVVAYLTSRAGAVAWAEQGFDLSANNHATRGYVDAQLLKKALALATAAGFTPDIGDTIQPSFGAAEWAALVDVISGAMDIPTALSAAAGAQAADLGED
ncbi:MAG: carbohydrate ABC transporter substrate-binding protein [Chloroflexi bacterium]|nr:carbohydrate ABC transporter substrate-binding protein [Chloroflexota bacterium]